MSTFGLQVNVVVRPNVCAENQFPHDDGKAVDITLGCTIEGQIVLSQKLWGGPVQLCNKEEEEEEVTGRTE